MVLSSVRLRSVVVVDVVCVCVVTVESGGWAGMSSMSCRVRYGAHGQVCGSLASICCAMEDCGRARRFGCRTASGKTVQEGYVMVDCRSTSVGQWLALVIVEASDVVVWRVGCCGASISLDGSVVRWFAIGC